MTSGFWRACVLALLPIFVQQLAATHALEHVADHAWQLAPDGEDADCPECLLLGGLQPGGISASVPWPLADLADAPPALDLAAEPPRRSQSAHAIRAPPENRN
jgi:hypothetical protein